MFMVEYFYLIRIFQFLMYETLIFDYHYILYINSYKIHPFISKMTDNKQLNLFSIKNDLTSSFVQC